MLIQRCFQLPHIALARAGCLRGQTLATQSVALSWGDSLLLVHALMLLGLENSHGVSDGHTAKL